MPGIKKFRLSQRKKHVQKEIVSIPKPLIGKYDRFKCVACHTTLPSGWTVHTSSEIVFVRSIYIESVMQAAVTFSVNIDNKFS